MVIIPSILESTFEEVQKKVHLMKDVADLIQIDIVDGKYVPGNTFLDVEKLNELNGVNFELDLWVENPVEYVKKELYTVNRVCTHVERFDAINDFIAIAKEKNWKVGLSVGPDTETSKLTPYLNKIDYVQFVTVHPGAQGNPFVPEVLEKIWDFKLNNPTMVCQADGSINMETIESVAEAGVSRFAVGSALFRAEDPVAEFLKLQKVEL